MICSLESEALLLTPVNQLGPDFSLFPRPSAFTNVKVHLLKSSSCGSAWEQQQRSEIQTGRLPGL